MWGGGEEGRVASADSWLVGWSVGEMLCLKLYTRSLLFVDLIYVRPGQRVPELCPFLKSVAVEWRQQTVGWLVWW